MLLGFFSLLLLLLLSIIGIDFQDSIQTIPCQCSKSVL
jgi:hypothetical protein